MPVAKEQTMTQAQAIEGFLSQKSVALVGASRGGK